MKLRAFLLALAWSGAVLAHKPSDSYLALDAERMRGSWDIALRDLDDAIGLDDDGDGAITWGELRHHQEPLMAYALSRLAIRGDGVPCKLQPAGLAVDTHSDGTYAVLSFTIGCSPPRTSLTAQYSLLFDLDPTHRGLVRVTSRTGVENAVLGPDTAILDVNVAPPGLLRFVRAGTAALFGHLLALLLALAVLVPAALRRRPLREQLERAVAFVLPQAIMLVLVATGALEAPLRWATTGLILSFALAVLAAFAHPATRSPWFLAYVFGFASGAAFSNRFASITLSGATPGRALLGFNLGLLLGIAALAAALAFAPFALRRTSAPRTADAV